MSHNQEIGGLGEKTACKFLVKRGFEVIDRNYRRKYGEIDVVAIKGEILHFVEVKTVSRDISYFNEKLTANGGYRPEDNVHPWKIQRMRRVIQAYLADKKVSPETDWQFDVLTILLDIKDKKAKVEFLENIIL